MSPALRITIAQGAFLPVPPLLGGAVEKAWHALGRELARRGHQVVHVSRAYAGLPAVGEEDGVRHVRVSGFSPPRSLWRLKLLDLQYSWRVRRVLPPADVLVTNTFWLPLIERRQSRGLVYVHVARYPKGQLRLYPRRTVLQTVSAPIRDAIVNEIGVADGRVRVVPYPLSPAYLVPRVAPENTILFAGRLHPEKGIHVLIDAFARLHAADVRDWKLRIVGPWEFSQGGAGPAYRDRLLEAARPLGDRVEILEPVFDEAELVRHYQRAAIFAYPSLAEFGETFGLAVLEAMAAGCAPVVSALPCFRDFVRPGESGAVFDHRAADPAGQLARVLGELVQDAARREALRTAAWLTARDFTLERVGARLVRDFHALTENPAAFRGQTTLCANDSP